MRHKEEDLDELARAVKKVQCFLKKLTPEKFHRIFAQLADRDIAAPRVLAAIVRKIFEKDCLTAHDLARHPPATLMTTAPAVSQTSSLHRHGSLLEKYCGRNPSSGDDANTRKVRMLAQPPTGV